MKYGYSNRLTTIQKYQIRKKFHGLVVGQAVLLVFENKQKQ